MKKLDKHYNGFVFVAFYALYGYAISFNLTSADSYRIAARFCQTNFSFDQVWYMYQAGLLTDVYLIFIYSIVKLFTNNPKVLFGLLGSIMGFFSYLSIRQLYAVWKLKRDKYFYIIVFFYFLTISFFNINGIRFWTATSCFSYFAIQYLYFNKRYAIIGVLLTPLIHFGYMLGVVAFLAFLLVQKFLKGTRLFYFIFVCSFIVNLVMPQSAVDDIMGSNGDTETFSSNSAVNSKYRNYRITSENIEKGEKRSKKDQTLYRKANSAYTKFFDWVNKIGMFIMLSVLYRKRNNFVQNDKQANFFKFVLFMFSFGFIVTILIGSGGRFIRLANLLYVFWFLTVYQQNSSESWKKYTKLLILINFYALTFLLFNAPRLVTPLFWLMSPIVTLLDGVGFSPIDFEN